MFCTATDILCHLIENPKFSAIMLNLCTGREEPFDWKKAGGNERKYYKSLNLYTSFISMKQENYIISIIEKPKTLR